MNRRIEKDKHDATPLGQAEKKLRKFYNEVEYKRVALKPEDKLFVNKLRTENEAAIMAYEKDTNEKLKEIKAEWEGIINGARVHVDGLLLSAMEKEIAHLEKYNVWQK
jgi:hypothetical protein